MRILIVWSHVRPRIVLAWAPFGQAPRGERPTGRLTVQSSGFCRTFCEPMRSPPMRLPRILLAMLATTALVVGFMPTAHADDTTATYIV